VDQDEEETWDMVGPTTERSISPLPTTGEVVPELAQQGAGADDLQMSAEERKPNPSPAMVPEQPEDAQAEDEATAEARIVDITSILGAPTVIVVRSTL
jgi:hypothetical protein